MEKRMFTIEGNMCGDRVRIGRAMHTPPLTQQQLADKLHFLGNDGMTKAIISRIEKRERRVVDGELVLLAVALGVSTEWLAELTDDPTRK